MTTIAAYIDPETKAVAMAGDRLVHHGDSPICEAVKVFRKGDMLIGVAGPSRVRNAIAGANLRPWTPVALAGWLESSGHTGADVLVAHEGILYIIDEDGALDRCATHYAAVGSGMQYALGALHAMDGEPASSCVIAAVSAACDLDLYTGGEIDVEVME